jgi:hypothetical protein
MTLNTSKDWLTALETLKPIIYRDVKSLQPKLLNVLFELAESSPEFVEAAVQAFRDIWGLELLIGLASKEMTGASTEVLFRHDSFATCTLRAFVVEESVEWTRKNILIHVENISNSKARLLASSKDTEKHLRLCGELFENIVRSIRKSKLPLSIVRTFSLLVDSITCTTQLDERSACIIVISNLLMLRSAVPKLWRQIGSERVMFVKLQKMLVTTFQMDLPTGMDPVTLHEMEKAQKSLHRWSHSVIKNNKATLRLTHASLENDAMLPTEVTDWSKKDVVHWVNLIGMAHLGSVLRYNRIDGETLLSLVHKDFIDMGI